MYKIFVFTFIILSFASAHSQNFNNGYDYPLPGQGSIAGGMGLNWIDGELYYTFHFRPEISFADLGVGLDLNLDVNREGKLRKENFNELSDYLSIIRYVRYGVKNDPLFIKLGALDYYTLGHGSILYQYNNSPSIDSRKTGLVFDIDFGQFGFESIYSQFAEAGVVGVRGYIRPLKFTTLGSIPIIGNLEVGGTYAADYSNNAAVISGFYNHNTKKFETISDKGSMNILGLDIGLPILSSSMLDVQLYADYSKIINFGSGIATGVFLNFKGLGLIDAEAKLERRFNNGQYIPAYFNSMYEIEKFKVDTSKGTFSSKAGLLAATHSADNGYYGGLRVTILGTLNILGSYQRLDKTPNSGILHLTSQIEPEQLSFILRAGYDKLNIKDEKDLFTLDDRSFLFFELGYKPLPYAIVSLVYNWTFSPIRDASDNIIDYIPQKRIEPRISFIYPFSY